MSRVRKLSFQLTALLDLLLIVIFAQFMEVQQESREVQTSAAERLAEAEHKLSEAEAALATLRVLRADEPQRAELRSENDRLRQQQAELNEALRQTAEQRDTVARLTAELFRIPQEQIEQAMAPMGRTDPTRTPEEIARLREQFREMGQMRSEEMVRHLLTYDELRKRADVWEVYVADNGMTMFDTGDRRFQFRAQTGEAFARELFERYKASPQPKGLVIILLSWGQTPLVWRNAAQEGLRQAADRMRADSGDRTRFEYAVLGYRPRDSRTATP